MFKFVIVYLASHVPRPIFWEARLSTMVPQLQQEKIKHELIREVVVQDCKEEHCEYWKWGSLPLEQAEL